MNAFEAFALVARARFEPFTEADWEAFCGCVTETPQIAEVDGFTLILDGDVLSVTDSEFGEENVFRLDEA
jgi:hypothetical protein